MSFQSMGQYRTALLREIDNTTNQTNPLDEKELIDLVSSLWVTANSLDHFGQCHEVSPGLLRRASEFISKQDARIDELAGALASPEAVTQPPNALPARVLAMCKKRGWDLSWSSRGVYLHLEASELIEALRGKHGDPLSEAADVLLVLMSITENAGIPWCDVLNQTAMTCARLEVCDPYPREERGALTQSAPALAVVPVEKGPSINDIRELCVDIELLMFVDSSEYDTVVVAILEIARAVLARWGHPASVEAGEGLSDEEILRIAAKELGYEFTFKWFLTGSNCLILETDPCELLNFARAIIPQLSHPATLPAPEVGEGRWSEGVCGDGAAILFDGVMIPVEEVVQALNRAPTVPPAPETSNFDPRLIALATTSEQIPSGLYSEHELQTEWNAQADEFNQWESLDSSEQLAWAQARAIAADRNGRPATLPAPEVLSMALRLPLPLFAPPGQQAELAEVKELVAALELDADRGDHFYELANTTAEQFRRVATLLQQQQARIAFLRYVLIDCGQAVGGLVNQSCSGSFLLDVATEVRLAVAKVAPAVVPDAGLIDVLIKAEAILADIVEGESPVDHGPSNAHNYFAEQCGYLESELEKCEDLLSIIRSAIQP
jgi:hypothetical protein